MLDNIEMFQQFRKLNDKLDKIIQLLSEEKESDEK